MRLELNITTGNAAVQTPIDVADLLHHVAGTLAGKTLDEVAAEGRKGIRDFNGNTVGSFAIVREANDD